MKEIKKVSALRDGSLVDENGSAVIPPGGWAFLQAGDAGVTRKVTATKNYWKVVFRRGRREMSKGIWAPKEVIENAKTQMDRVRTAPDYAKKMETAKKYREKKQEQYEEEFKQAIHAFLSFHTRYKALEKEIVLYVTEHAIPVGSGTVARTQMIPLQDRARMAVLAWMRHKTTNYDRLQIARVRGERKAVRRNLAQQSTDLLQQYRDGAERPNDCPMFRGILQERRIREDLKRRMSYAAQTKRSPKK